tara:strand:- start:143 stop:298 length:156 start_codon:yes stop_codon:yes gene_type:complete
MAISMELLASFSVGGFQPSAAVAGVVALLLFAIVGVIAGPNLEKFDVEAKK